ncbi:redoxin domain-containing protein [Sulfurimonas aquatica]|uniref:Redoxin domain-containing protein n=1 Tax=Sulfurimonas aquatica TaxID=2672570 RepID=A0A975AYK9_9BACT|nr:TlpA disulfide reductase family protein [Sulfurimonas aquatica]QSZ40982.1 redoxin domain-containing protein [Sulfurimonas aquatica]
MKKLITLLFLTLSLLAAPKVGDKAVSFELPNLYDASKKSLNSDFEGKVILLNIWASWCPGCKEEMPLFVKLQEEFDKKDFSIVLANIDSEAINAISFLEEVDDDAILTALYDESKKLPKEYRCIGLPSSYLIDKSGTIVEVYVGALNENAIVKLKEKIKNLIGK